jgi:hypothetical protein
MAKSKAVRVRQHAHVHSSDFLFERQWSCTTRQTEPRTSEQSNTLSYGRGTRCLDALTRSTAFAKSASSMLL